jgi:DNA-binding transcriptional LysR family regulator
MEEGALAIERITTGANQELQGIVRVSLIEDLGSQWLPNKLNKFHVEFPQLAIEVNIDNRNVNLLRREADIAVRLARPEQADLICRKVGMLYFGLYASQSYLDEHGIPEHRRDLKDHFHVGFDEEMGRSPNIQKLESFFDPTHIRHRSNSHIEMMEATRVGLGCTALCCCIADPHPDLRRILIKEINYGREIWLVTHAEINSSARIRAVFDFLGEALEEDAEKLEGLSKSN